MISRDAKGLYPTYYIAVSVDIYIHAYHYSHEYHWVYIPWKLWKVIYRCLLMLLIVLEVSCNKVKVNYLHTRYQ